MSRIRKRWLAVFGALVLAAAAAGVIAGASRAGADIEPDEETLP